MVTISAIVTPIIKGYVDYIVEQYYPSLAQDISSPGYQITITEIDCANKPGENYEIMGLQNPFIYMVMDSVNSAKYAYYKKMAPKAPQSVINDISGCNMAGLLANYCPFGNNQMPRDVEENKVYIIEKLTLANFTCNDFAKANTQN